MEAMPDWLSYVLASLAGLVGGGAGARKIFSAISDRVVVLLREEHDRLKKCEERLAWLEPRAMEMRYMLLADRGELAENIPDLEERDG